MHKLEHHIRADLDAHSPRMLAVLRPLRVVITNLPEGHAEEVDARLRPNKDGDTSSYKVPFGRVVYIEEGDFREDDSKDYYGLAPGKAVMLRYAYPITCTGFTRDPATGRVAEVTATYERDFRDKKPPKGVLNWVGSPPGKEPLAFEARLYDHLFKSEDPSSMEDWLGDVNPESMTVVRHCYGSPALAAAKPGDRFQFERLGYFAVDPDSAPGRLVVNRTVTLKESVATKAAKK